MKEVISSIVAVLMLFIVINIVPVISATDHSFSALTSVSYTPTYNLNLDLEGCKARYQTGGGAFSEPINSGSPVTVPGLPRTSDLVVRFTLDNENSELSVTATIGGSSVGTYNQDDPDGPTLTVQADKITGNINITATPFPPGVSMKQYTADEPSEALSEIRTAFQGYKYLTFDGVAGRWIIIGAYDKTNYGNAFENKDELDPGQVLLLSENIILDESNNSMYIRYDDETRRNADWSTSEIRAYLNGISIEGNDGTTNYQNSGFYQNSGLKEKYGSRIVGQSLKTAWYNGNTKSVTTNETGDVDHNGTIDESEVQDKIFLLATTKGDDGYSEENLGVEFTKGQNFCAQTYLGEASSGEFINGKWIAYYDIYDGHHWWLRSGCTADDHINGYRVYGSGRIFIYASTPNMAGVRPAFVFQTTTATLSFDANYGSVYPTSKEVIYNSPIGELPTPTREGYTFTGWKIDGVGDPITAETTYIWTENKEAVAQWTAKTYTLSFDVNGGEWKEYSFPMQGGSSEPFIDIGNPITVIYGVAIGGNLVIPIRGGYTFIGWAIDDILLDNTIVQGAAKQYIESSTLYTWDGDKTAFAQWGQEDYTLSFNANGGRVTPTSRWVTANAAIGALPVPTYPGYTFTGWKINEDTENISIDSTTTYIWPENKTAVAQWVRLPTGVHLGTCDPGTAFDGYYYLTFDNVSSEASGKWIIIGANDTTNYGSAVENPNELDSGQVLLLSEGCIKDNQKFHSSSNNWSTSSVRTYLVGDNGISGLYASSGLKNYNIVLQEKLHTIYAKTFCEPDDYMFLLAGKGEKFNAETYLTTAPKRNINVYWWLRSGDPPYTTYACRVDRDGTVGTGSVRDDYGGVRPAFVLDLNDIPAS